jgi:muramoyltetrapeptide carboxypeptidase
VNEHPYRIERSLLQLHQAGVLDAQAAVLLGGFTDFNRSPLDRGYGLKAMLAHLRSLTRTPILTGLPFGHVPTRVCLPVGARAQLVVEGRDVLLGWA